MLLPLKIYLGARGPVLCPKLGAPCAVPIGTVLHPSLHRTRKYRALFPCPYLEGTTRGTVLCPVLETTCSYLYRHRALPLALTGWKLPCSIFHPNYGRDTMHYLTLINKQLRHHALSPLPYFFFFCFVVVVVVIIIIIIVIVIIMIIVVIWLWISLLVYATGHAFNTCRWYLYLIIIWIHLILPFGI